MQVYYGTCINQIIPHQILYTGKYSIHDSIFIIAPFTLMVNEQIYDWANSNS